jgi:hypothetical protein
LRCGSVDKHSRRDGTMSYASEVHPQIKSRV